MTQDVDVQLKVWKDLAISKQILMGAATDALGLDAECSSDELKQALNRAIERARDADINIQETRSTAERQVTEYREKVEVADPEGPELIETLQALGAQLGQKAVLFPANEEIVANQQQTTI